jgi:hypothetical protein
MRRRARRHNVPVMLSPSAIVWNAVMPALGITLLLGAALVPAVLVAAAVSLAIIAPTLRRG